MTLRVAAVDLGVVGDGEDRGHRADVRLDVPATARDVEARGLDEHEAAEQVGATLGGEPTDVQFQVVGPPRPTVTKTTHPKPKKQPSATATPQG